jgi:hypothetical protein
LGNLEITLMHQLVPETDSNPAIAVAGELKVPTARNNLIGTGNSRLHITTTDTAEGSGTGNPVAQEAAGGEAAALIGFQYRLAPSLRQASA